MYHKKIAFFLSIVLVLTTLVSCEENSYNGDSPQSEQYVTAEPPPQAGEAYTPTQVFEDETFGRFIPELSIATCYEGWRIHEEEGEDSLYSNWTVVEETGASARVQINVMKMTPEKESRIVSPENTVEYDISPYTRPWIESLPSEIYDKVFKPIFRAEELTEEMLKIRVATNRLILFYVLYDDILVDVWVETFEVPPDSFYDLLVKDLWESLKVLPR